MKTFYVRPPRPGGYGRGDGSSFENAWNGFAAIDWRAVAAAEPAMVWACGNAPGPGFTTVQVEHSYLQEIEKADGRQERPHPRREPAIAV